MSLFSVNSELYKANSDPKARVYVNQGGTSSGKTYCIMQRLIEIALTEKRSIITVVGKDLPNLKVGSMRDMRTILFNSPYLTQSFTENRSENYFIAKNGSIIEFKSYEDAQDAKNGKRDYLFVNEANGITYEVYWQLQIRTKKKIFIDYNPSARFWVHDKVIGGKGVKLIITDHRGNKHLTEEEHRRIESIDDKELWTVYARGLTGKLTGLVFQNFSVVDSMPPISQCKKHGHGMDFGYTNDPTTLIDVRLAMGELWLDEVIYEAGLTNPEIAVKCKEAGLTRADKIIADSAEMKSIAELKNMGLWVVPAVKGADSVNAGIDIMRRYHINITRRSVNLLKEFTKYKYKVDMDGNPTNKPIDKFNHGIDAARYCCMDILQERRVGAARAINVRLY